MKKIVFILIILFLFQTILTFKINKLLAEDNPNINFILKNVEGKELFMKIGKGKFFNIKYNLSKSDSNYKLLISGKGAVEFIISFENYKIIFPEKKDIFISPLIVLKNSENQYLMFSVPNDNLYYFEFFEKDNNSFISYNIYIKKKENIFFNIKIISSLEDAFEEYFKIYKERNRKIENGGLIVPDTSFTKIRNLGINNFNIKYRIVDPKVEAAADRINEASFFGIENLLILNPVSLKFENISIDNLVKRLYFKNEDLSRLDSIVLLNSGLKDKNNQFINYVKKSEPVYKYVSGKPIIDYKENSYDTIFLLNPSPDYLKNKGISAYEIFYNRYINPIDISIKYYNNESGLTEDKKSRYLGFAIDFSDVIDVFNFDKAHFGKYPTSYIENKEAQFYLIPLYDLIEKVGEKNLILSINPKYFQLFMNSDMLYKEIDNLNEINDFPIERILVRNRPIFYSYKLKEDEINKENLEKIFNFSLFYGIYPTFTKPENEPFAIWDYQDKLNELLPFIKYYEIINQIEKVEFKPKIYSSISNGSLIRFGDFPEIYLTINGSGVLRIDKKSLNIDKNFKIIDLIENKEVKYKEDNETIILNISNEKVIKIFSNENQKSINIISKIKNEKLDIYYLLPIILIFLSILFTKFKFKLKINPYFLITFIFISLSLIKFYFNITSPYFIFLSMGILIFLNSLYESGNKSKFLFNYSIIFFIISLIYHLLTKSKINIIPPFYSYFDLYYFVIILYLYFHIFYHFKWRLIFDFFIFLSLFISFFLTNLITTPFYTPPIDLSFLINFIILIFITFIISIKNRKNFIFLLINLLLFVIYIFWDRIYYFLLLRNIFIGLDFITFFITLFFTFFLVITFLRKEFKTKPNIVYFLFFITLLLNSLILNNFHFNIPNKFTFMSSISRLIFYIILIIYLIYFSESLLTKKEE
jgi:hypothetical protein